MRAIILCVSLTVSLVVQSAELIDLYSPESLKAHSPIIVGHRGGAVVEGIPENSLAALRLAAQRGYAMVEVDVRATSDGVPIAFHDSELEEHVGVSGSIESMTYEQVKSLRYLEGDEFSVLTLEESLSEASRLGLGVMLDIKTGQEREDFYYKVAELLQTFGLTRATLTISGHANTRRYLKDSVMQRVSKEDWERVKAGELLDLSGQVWFDWPRYISNEEVAQMQRRGALVVPTINVFHYPQEEHMARAAADIERMREAGVDAYQIDAPYDRLVLQQ